MAIMIKIITIMKNKDSKSNNSNSSNNDSKSFSNDNRYRSYD